MTMIKADLINISKFMDQANYDINSKYAEINVRVEKNNTLINTYKTFDEKKLKRQSEFNRKVDLATEIFSNNFDIMEQKFSLMETHFQEIYKKLETLAKSLSKVIDITLENDNSRVKD